MKLPGFATRNLALKGLAGILATVMWAGVAYASNPPDTRSVTVRVPQDQAAVAPYVLVHPIADLVVRVSGTRAHLNAFTPADLEVSVDYRAIRRVGLQALRVSITNNDQDVTLDNPTPAVVAEVDRLDSRTVGVSVVYGQQPPAGYVVVSSSVTPSTVTVIGPQHQLGGLQAEVTVNLASQKTNFQGGEKVEIIDTHHQAVGTFGVTIGPSQGEVLVTIDIAAVLTSRASAVLPRVSGTPPAGHYLEGLTVSSPTAVLQGPQDLLNTLDSVATDVIALGGLTGTTSFTVHLRPPAGVTATPSTVTVTVTIIALPPPPTPAPTPSPAATPTPTPRPTP